MLEGIAEVLDLDVSDRAALFTAFAQGGKYADVVGIFRDNSVNERIGLFDHEMVDALPASVKWIASNGAGYDNVDFGRMKERGIKLSNTPGAVDDATATTALYLIISALRQFSIGERSLRLGTWKPAVSESAFDLTGKTLGILGLGGIGLRIAELAHAFPMRVVYHNRKPNPDAPEYCEYVGDVKEMLGRADVVSVSVPLNAQTKGLVGEDYIRAMKKGACLVNTARGAVVDEEAMIRALEDGHLGSIGLDVFPDEPNVNPRLLEFSNATLLPHMGTHNQDTSRTMEVRTMQNLVDYLKTGSGKDIIPEMR